MSVLVDIVNAVVQVGQTVSDFITTGIYDLLVKFTAWFIQWSVVGYWKIKLAAIEFSWDVASEIITTLNISSYINSAWSSLNSQVLSMFVFFRIPEAVNIVVSAGVSKFVMRFLGF